MLIFPTIRAIVHSSALGSKQASSLDPLAIALKRQKERRQLVGRQTGSVYTKEVLAASEKLQERNRIDYTGGSSPPKLQGTVPKLPPPKSPLAVLEGGKVPWSAEKTKSPDPLDSEEEDDDDDMTGGVTTRNMAKSVDNGKKVQLKKSDWDKVVAKEKENKATITQLNQANTNLKKDLEKSETLVAQLRLQIATLQKNRGGGKGRKSNCRKDEQKDDVKEAIKGYVKDVLFRTVKFAQPGSELKAATLSVWNGIKDNLKLDEGAHPLTPADFREIYESEVAAQLSGRRQYCQSRIQEACAGT